VLPQENVGGEATAKLQTTRVSAYGLVVRANRLLLCRLSADATSNVGEWTLPGGGIEFGEEPAAAVVREVFEETGLHVSVTELVAVDSRTFELEDQKLHNLRIIFRADVERGDLTYETDGSTDMCGWFTLEEASALPMVGLARRGIELAFG
jgi:8-oxo-dGTP diphosphatase